MMFMMTMMVKIGDYYFYIIYVFLFLLYRNTRRWFA